jgi:hypothetical protein
MYRIPKLEKLISDLDEKKSDDELLKYIGTGNPNADILIIGKESSVEDENSEQFIFELKGNFKDWQRKRNYNQDDVLNFNTWDDYDPILPYKGQKYNIDNGSNGGTSRTWYTYQKLINYIFDKPDNKDIDFHKDVFITEVNSTPSRKTVDADISSIDFRKDLILKSDFFQSFPIVIISGVGYFKITTNSNEIEEIFSVKYLEKKFAEGKESQPYWIHSNKDNQPSKLLINTYQLSIGISDDLLQEIANMIKKEIKIMKPKS